MLPLLTKNLSIENYSIWVQINITTSLIIAFASLGLPYTMVRYLSGIKNKRETAASFYSIVILVIISSFVVSLLFYILATPLANFLFGGNVIIAKITSIIIFFTCINSIFITYFRTFRQMKRYSIFTILQTYLNLFIASYLAISGYGIVEIVFGVLITQIITLVIISSVIINEIGLKSPKTGNLREYLSFGIPTIPGNLSSWIVDASDRYVIGILIGIIFVGYYNPGYTLGGIIAMFLAPFSFLLPSVLPKYYDKNQFDKVETFLKYSLKYFLLLAIPATFGLSILSKPLLLILTTPTIASEGYIITPFVCISQILFGLYGIMINTLVLNYKTKIIAIVWFIAAIFNLGLNIILVPIIGIIGAAISTLLAYTIVFLIIYYYSQKYFHIKIDLIFIFKSIIASGIMSIFIIFTNPYNLLNIVGVVLLSIIIYSLVLFLLKGIEINEINLFKKLLKK